MTKKAVANDKFMSTVKIGPKGQIVIPKEVRDMFSLKPGDMMLLLADKSRGIALNRYDVLSKAADDIFKMRAEGKKEDNDERD